MRPTPSGIVKISKITLIASYCALILATSLITTFINSRGEDQEGSVGYCEIGAIEMLREAKRLYEREPNQDRRLALLLGAEDALDQIEDRHIPFELQPFAVLIRQVNDMMRK